MRRAALSASLLLALASGCTKRSRTPEARADVAAYLDSHRGGWCATEPKQAVALCVSSSPTFSDVNSEGALCLDDLRSGRAGLRRTYPNGMTVTVGFHYDGARPGDVLTFGSSDYLSLVCDPSIAGRRVEIGVDDAGHLFASGPDTAPLSTEALLASGSHLVEYRVARDHHELFVDGVHVASGAGTGGVTVEIPERWSPGFVLGDHNQRWWACTPGGPTGALRMAGFLVHLMDEARPGDTFELGTATTANDATVLLFDERGVKGMRWEPSAGVDVAAAHARMAAQSYGARWTDDVWTGCLSRDAP